MDAADDGACRFAVDPADLADARTSPEFFSIQVSIGPPGTASSYADVEDAFHRDPSSLAVHPGHEVTAIEQLPAPGWTYGYLAESRSVADPGIYSDDEVARAAVSLVTDTESLHCAGELTYPGVRIADVRPGVADLLRYCASVKDALWTP